MSKEIIAWIRLVGAQGVGPKTFFNLVKQFGQPEYIISNLDEINYNLKFQIAPLSQAKAEDEVAKCNAFGAQIILFNNEKYPAQLKEISSAPPLLMVKGKIELLKKDIIAIVGTRNASISGEKMAYNIAATLGKNSVVVASGMAKGIDAAAHNGSLQYGTIGVVAGGINVVYPKENTKLYEKTYKDGLIITENFMDVQPVSGSFPRRNRIIAGISKGVLVVEAMERSGTIITANYALEQGKDVFAIPGSPSDLRARGTNNLIKNGAILVQSGWDIIQEMSISVVKNSASQENYERNMNDPKEIILSKLTTTPIDIDELIAAVDMSQPDLHLILMELELEDKILRPNLSQVMLKY